MNEWKKWNLTTTPNLISIAMFVVNKMYACGNRYKHLTDTCWQGPMYHLLLLGFLSILGDKDDIPTVYGCLFHGNRIISLYLHSLFKAKIIKIQRKHINFGKWSVIAVAACNKNQTIKRLINWSFLAITKMKVVA